MGSSEKLDVFNPYGSRSTAALTMAGARKARLSVMRTARSLQRSCRANEPRPAWAGAPVLQREVDHAPQGFSPVYQEYQVGDFECDFTLSGDFDSDRIESSLTNGMLRLIIPRAEQAAARPIKITPGN